MATHPVECPGAGTGAPGRVRRLTLLLVVGGCGAIGLASLALPSAPTYDPWAWLIWGREIAELDLDTTRGPAWKPLPVLIATALAPLGATAPYAWLALERTATLLALPLAYRVSGRLVAPERRILAGVLAATGVLLTQTLLWHTAVGNSEGVAVMLLLLALDRHAVGRPVQAIAALAAVSLLRVETWPFLAAYALVGARPGVLPAVGRRVRLPPVPLAPLFLLGTGILALWVVPDWLGSGDFGRSSDRARIVEPGAPALADWPALESVRTALELVPVPLLAGAVIAVVLALRAPPGSRIRGAVLPTGAAAAWIAIVAAMSEAGYSGEGRYSLPAAAVLAVPGAAGITELAARAQDRARAVPAIAAVVVATTAGFAAAGADSPAVLDRLSFEARLYGRLDEVVGAAGGPAAVLACGQAVTGPLAVPAVAWQLAVPMARIGRDVRPGQVVFAARPTAAQPVAPSLGAVHASGLELRSRRGLWTVYGACERRGAG